MKKVDFSVFMDRHAAHAARDDRKKADSMDCHDFASAKSRNDRNLFFQQDSRVCKQSPKFNKQAKDSKICDEKAGLRCLLRGDKARWLSHKQKASSLLYRAKLNPPKEQKWN